MTRVGRRVAVVGSGVAGLSAAHALAPRFDTTLFEAAGRCGGHAHTVDLALEGHTHGVDTGFLVYNRATYPQLVALFAELDVETTPSDMSFSVQAKGDGIEWSGSGLGTVFAQRGNLGKPRFWRMLAEIVRFNRLTTALAMSPGLDPDEAGNPATAETVGQFLDRHRFPAVFRDWYFLPMVGCIWSCPTGRMLQFPMTTMIRFCHNHGLLRVTGRPQWRTVRGGSRNYVAKMLESVTDVRLNTPIRRVLRPAAGGVEITTDAARERFDAVVMACHSDETLAMLGDPSPAERELLGAVRWHDNRAVLHTDRRVLPKRERAWAAWNFERAAHGSGDDAPVCLHYLINRLQPLPFTQPVIVSLNPIEEPAEASVHGEFRYAHPVFDAAAIAAQQRLPALQGQRDTWFCGAWTRYGFHEDGLVSGLRAAQQIIDRAAGAASAGPVAARSTAVA